jgi:predicted polyphosphate/ATP-dependent NAD kinase
MAGAAGRRRIGLIVNPIAGMGGRVGLKGTDGRDIVARAVEKGARPEAGRRAGEALESLAGLKDRIEVLTYPGEMGEDVVRAAGFACSVLGSIRSGQTTPEDTRRAAQDLEAAGVDLLLFAGGDGTARDICAAVGDRLPVLGIPAGVKMHSAVFGISPRRAGELAALYVEGKIRGTREAEVMDIDEEAFRQERVCAKLYGYLRVPSEPRLVQGVKAGGGHGEASALRGIALDVTSRMEPGVAYLIGPGTTTREILHVLGLSGTLLGVDVVVDRRIEAADADERVLLETVERMPARIVVSVIGGQGYLFGRGNQQLSPRILARVGKENVIVAATPGKIFSLRGLPLLVDTGDPDVDRMLTGYVQIVTGLKERLVYPVAC